MKSFHDYSESLIDDITKLVDNTLDDPEREKYLLELIAKDEYLKGEYEIQFLVKNLLIARRPRLASPPHLIKLIEDSLNK